MNKVKLPTNWISDRWRAYRSSRNLAQIANRPDGPETMGARAPFSSFALTQTGQRRRRPFSEQAVIPRTEWMKRTARLRIRES